MSHSLALHPLIIILSVIGGIGMLGPLGIIYGPVAVVLLITFLEIYRSDLSYEGEE
jgi:predicted PurR-regulated permease PerM